MIIEHELTAVVSKWINYIPTNECKCDNVYMQVNCIKADTAKTIDTRRKENKILLLKGVSSPMMTLKRTEVWQSRMMFDQFVLSPTKGSLRLVVDYSTGIST